jgi:hypothetical protein
VSFILDALRKSEHARQHLGGATLAELPLGRRHRSQPWWVLGLAALLVVNIVLFVVLLKKPSAPESEAGSQRVPVVNQAARTIAPAPLAQEAAPPPIVQYESIPRSESPLDIGTPEGPTLVRAIDRPAAEFAAPANAGGVAQMHLDMHVYAKDPKERIAFINKRKYAEGETTVEGPRVAEITPDGVVLLYQGQRMELARQ